MNQLLSRGSWAELLQGFLEVLHWAMATDQIHRSHILKPEGFAAPQRAESTSSEGGAQGSRLRSSEVVPEEKPRNKVVIVQTKANVAQEDLTVQDLARPSVWGWGDV